MFYLEIWIRKGEDEFGTFEIKESPSCEIRYEYSFQFHKSRKRAYFFRVSLEYQENKLRWIGNSWRRKPKWVFQGRSSPSIENDFIWGRYGKYSFERCEFETTG